MQLQNQRAFAFAEERCCAASACPLILLLLAPSLTRICLPIYRFFLKCKESLSLSQSIRRAILAANTKLALPWANFSIIYNLIGELFLKSTIKCQLASWPCNRRPTLTACSSHSFQAFPLSFGRIYAFAGQPIFSPVFSMPARRWQMSWACVGGRVSRSCRSVAQVCCGRGVTIYQLFAMAESCEGKGVYRKINKQMKFQFLNKVLAQGQSIYEAAEQIGIHYSTAKTIIFFHKHNHKSYRSFKLEDTAPVAIGVRANYKEIAGEDNEQPIKIVSNSHFMKWQPRKELKAGNIALTYLRNSKTELKTHPIRKPSKKSSSAQSGRLERGSSQEELLSESEASSSLDSSYVYNR